MSALLGFYLGRHLQDQHNAAVNAQTKHLGIYTDIMNDTDLPDNVRHDVTLAAMDASRKPAGWFRGTKAQQQLQTNLEKWTAEREAFKQQQPPPPPPPGPPTLASQGPPSGNPPTIAGLGQIPQSGGELFGPMTGMQPSASALGQTMTPRLQTPGPVPPPPGAMDAPSSGPAIPGGFIYDPFGSGLRRQGAKDKLEVAKKDAEYRSQYGAQFDAMARERRDVAAFQLDLGKQRLKALEDAGLKIPDQMKAIVLSGMAIPGMANSMRPITSPSPVPGSTAPEGQLDIFGNPVGAGPYRVRSYPISGETEWIPAALAQRTGFNAGGDAVQYDPRTPGSAAAAGVVAPPMATPRQFTGINGNIFLQSPASLAAGGTPMQVPGAVNPAMLPTTSVQTSPGAAPITTVRQKGGGARGSAASLPSDSFPAAIRMTAQQVSRGDLPLPVGRDGDAVKQYLAEHGKEVPVALSPKFQGVISEIDPRLETIRDLKTRLEALKQNNQRGYFAKSRLQYATGSTGGDSQTANDIAELSFAGLQSAGQLIKGLSRASNVLDKGLSHTPNVWIDSPALIYDKLTQLENQLKRARRYAIEDGRKSGVIGDLTPPPGGSAVDRLVERYGGR